MSDGAAVAKAALRAADHLGISSGALGRIFGSSEASISRLKRGTKEFGLAVLFVRLFRGLDALMGSDDEASRSWLAEPDTALGARPIDVIQTISGLVDAIADVDSRRAVV